MKFRVVLRAEVHAWDEHEDFPTIHEASVNRGFFTVSSPIDPREAPEDLVSLLELESNRAVHDLCGYIAEDREEFVKAIVESLIIPVEMVIARWQG